MCNKVKKYELVLVSGTTILIFTSMKTCLRTIIESLSCSCSFKFDRNIREIWEVNHTV